MGEMQRVSVQRGAQRAGVPPAREAAPAYQRRVGRHEADGPALRRMMAAGALQPRLTVGPVDDPFEREAERTADAVMAPGSAAKAADGGMYRVGIAAGLMRMVRRALGKNEPPARKDEEQKDDYKK